MTRMSFSLLQVLLILCGFHIISATTAESSAVTKPYDRIVLQDMTVIKASLVKEMGDSLAYFELNDPELIRHMVGRDKVLKWIRASTVLNDEQHNAEPPANPAAGTTTPPIGSQPSAHPTDGQATPHIASGQNQNDMAEFNTLAEQYRALETKPPLKAEARRYNVQAENAFNENRFDDAIESYYKVIRADQTWPPAYFNLSLLLENKNSYCEAMALLVKYLLLVPDAKDAAAAQNKIYVWEDKCAQQIKIRDKVAADSIANEKLADQKRGKHLSPEFIFSFPLGNFAGLASQGFKISPLIGEFFTRGGGKIYTGFVFHLSDYAWYQFTLPYSLTNPSYNNYFSGKQPGSCKGFYLFIDPKIGWGLEWRPAKRSSFELKALIGLGYGSATLSSNTSSTGKQTIVDDLKFKGNPVGGPIVTEEFDANYIFWTGKNVGLTARIGYEFGTLYSHETGEGYNIFLQYNSKIKIDRENLGIGIVWIL